MTNKNITDAITSQYSRDLRKQIVKTIIQHEKNSDKEALDSSYKVINQIFSYVISQLNWEMSDSSNKWDDTPLKIMSEAFPKIETTKWFKDQQLITKKSIELKNTQ